MAISKNAIKTIKALHRKKFRQKYNKFIVEGDKMVRELLHQQRYPVLEIYAYQQWVSQNEGLLTSTGVVATTVNEREMNDITQLSTPGPVLAIVAIPEASNALEIKGNWAIYLDALQDPGNVGTILRIADWFAIPYVIAGPGTVSLYNAKVIQATMGAFLRVRWYEAELSALHQQLPGHPIWLADMEGSDVFSHIVPDAGILVLGNEGQGVSDSSRQLATEVVSIPAPKGSGAESLNVGVATGILCAALRRAI